MRKKKAELPEIPELDDRDLARLLGLTRAAVGALCVIAPSRAARFYDSGPTDVAGRMAIRGLGARDVALGVGLMTALQNNGPVRSWLEGGVVADAGDLVAALLNWRSLSSMRKLLWLGATGGGVWLGTRLASSLD